nr:MAG TPA: hypothetical protein [Caudoviricetes sp.]
MFRRAAVVIMPVLRFLILMQRKLWKRNMN